MHMRISQKQQSLVLSACKMLFLELFVQSSLYTAKRGKTAEEEQRKSEAEMYEISVLALLSSCYLFYLYPAFIIL